MAAAAAQLSRRPRRCRWRRQWEGGVRGRRQRGRPTATLVWQARMPPIERFDVRGCCCGAPHRSQPTLHRAARCRGIRSRRACHAAQNTTSHNRPSFRRHSAKELGRPTEGCRGPWTPGVARGARRAPPMRRRSSAVLAGAFAISCRAATGKHARQWLRALGATRQGGASSKRPHGVRPWRRRRTAYGARGRVRQRAEADSPHHGATTVAPPHGKQAHATRLARLGGVRFGDDGGEVVAPALGCRHRWIRSAGRGRRLGLDEGRGAPWCHAVVAPLGVDGEADARRALVGRVSRSEAWGDRAG